MRFYLPDWDDFVDAAYDFQADAPSAVQPTSRDRAYIWDVFEKGDVPVDGVLISKRQVESSTVLDAPDGRNQTQPVTHHFPDWLTTVCDSGAWGYRALPFPPHSPTDILDFYDQLGASVGVTVDHLVLNSGKQERLYLNATAVPSSFTLEQMDATVRDRVDIVTAEWPDTWPSVVEQSSTHISGSKNVEEFDAETLMQRYAMLLPELTRHPQAVYRSDDAAVRQELSYKNAKLAMQRYTNHSYSFRLMGAVQGSDPASYARMTDQLLDYGFQYLGIGGVAGSSEHAINEIVRAVGSRIAAVEQEHQTRIDTHLFGFAKPAAFETIGRNRITTYDSSSPMRSAWTGGNNYHLSENRDYDALRIRYPEPTASLREAVELTLRGQELLCALRAFDADDSIPARVTAWRDRTETAIQTLPQYLRGHKHDVRYQQGRLETLRAKFQSHYPYAAILRRGFGAQFITRLVKLLRADSAMDPIDFTAYTAAIDTASALLDSMIPVPVSNDTSDHAAMDNFSILWELVERYTEFVDDAELLPAYHDLLTEQAWRECDCSICSDLGIEVAIFRGANRNKRRGYHNTKQLYTRSQAVLPRILVLTRGTPTLLQYDTIEEYLAHENTAVWRAIHDLPIVEIGVLTADGVHKWWDSVPTTVSFDPRKMRDTISTVAPRYDDIYVDTADWPVPPEIESAIKKHDCHLRCAASAYVLRSGLLRRIGYGEEFLPDQPASAL